MSPGAVARTFVPLMKFVRAVATRRRKGRMRVEGGEGDLERKCERIPRSGDPGTRVPRKMRKEGKNVYPGRTKKWKGEDKGEARGFRSPQGLEVS